MKIGIVSGTVNCIPILQFLKTNNVDVFLFSGDASLKNKDFEMVKQFCSITQIEVEENTSIYEWMLNKKIQLCFVCGYSNLIDLNQITDILHSTIFNIHYGSLPDFKGPTPLFWQIKQGFVNVSLCIHHINEKFDDGDVVWSKSIPNEEYLNYGLLEQRFSLLAVEGVIFIINTLVNHQPLPSIKNDNITSKYYKRPVLKDIVIDWETMTAATILNLIKACNPWNKGASTFFKGAEIKLLDAQIDYQKTKKIMTPGTIIDTKNTLKVACVNDEILKITFLNINGSFIPSRYIDKLGFAVDDVFKKHL